MKMLALVLFLVAQSPLDLAKSLQEQAGKLVTALTPAPTGYQALTDRLTRPKPALPLLGPAGTSYTDATFGAKVWRATDAKTSNGSALRVASNTSLASWNSLGSLFFVMDEGGSAHFFSFDPSSGPAPLPVTISSQIEPSFSYTDPATLYGAIGHRVRKWNVVTNVSADVLDLDTLGLSLGVDTYIGGLVTTDNEDYVTFFGGTGQDKHFYVRTGGGKLLDTRPLGFFVHSAIIERGGSHVIVFPAVDPNTGRMPVGITQIQVWDTATAKVAQVNLAWGGHASVGYGDLINADIVPGTPWDPMQWVYRKLSDLTTVKNLITPLLPPRAYPTGGTADHQNYRNAKAGSCGPFISSTYRYNYAGPWRAWDDEVIGITCDGTVYRFAHHFSLAVSFWDQPITSVRPQADWTLVTSNMNQSLNGRQDVFVVQLR